MVSPKKSLQKKHVDVTANKINLYNTILDQEQTVKRYNIHKFTIIRTFCCIFNSRVTKQFRFLEEDTCMVNFVFWINLNNPVKGFVTEVIQ